MLGMTIEGEGGELILMQKRGFWWGLFSLTHYGKPIYSTTLQRSVKAECQ